MRFLFLDVQALNVKERHFILPLVIVTFIMQSVAFISSPSQVRTKLIFPYNKRSYIFRSNFYCFCTDDNLLEGSYSIHSRYGGLSWHETGFKGFWMHK